MYKYRSIGTRQTYDAALKLKESVEATPKTRVRIRKRKPGHPLQTFFEVIVGEEIGDQPKVVAKQKPGSAEKLLKQLGI